MTPLTLAFALAGAILGALEHRWLVTRAYRKDTDTPHLERTPPVWATAALLGVALATLAAALPLPALLPAAFLTAASIPLAWIDWDVHRLPNNILGPLTLALTLIVIALAITTGHWDGLTRAAAGAGIGLALGILLALARAGLGAGDIKLLAPLGLTGAWISWTMLTHVLAAAFIVNGLAAAALLLSTRRTSHIAMGPGLLLGAILALAAA